MTALDGLEVWCTRWRLYNYVEPCGFVDVLQVEPGELTMLFLGRAGWTSGQLLGCGCALELLAIEEDCVVVEVEILVSWPAGRRQRTCGSPRGDSELSDSLRHCLDEEGCGCCVYGGYWDMFWDFSVGEGWATKRRWEWVGEEGTNNLFVGRTLALYWGKRCRSHHGSVRQAGANVSCSRTVWLHGSRPARPRQHWWHYQVLHVGRSSEEMQRASSQRACAVACPQPRGAWREPGKKLPTILNSTLQTLGGMPLYRYA